MPLNFQPERTDAASLRVNQLAIERHLRNDHYVRSIGPGAMALVGGATHAIVDRFAVAVCPDGSTTDVLFTFTKPSEWVLGRLKLEVWYSSPVADAVNNFRVGIQAATLRTGMVATAPTLLLAGINLLPGPAVANTILSPAPLYTTTSLASDHQFFSFRVVRTGAHADDTNNNEFHLYAARLEHIPAVQESQ